MKIEAGQRFEVIKGGKRLYDSEPWERKWKKGEVWTVEELGGDLCLTRTNKIGGRTILLGAVNLIRNGEINGKLKLCSTSIQ